MRGNQPKFLTKAELCEAAMREHEALDLGLGLRLGIMFTRGLAHSPNPTMHRPTAANTATFKSVSIMLAIH